MKKILCIVMGISILLFMSFVPKTHKVSKISKVYRNEQTVESYVKSLKYEIVSKKEDVYKHVLSKEDFKGPASVHYDQVWGVQEEEPDKYFGKEIVTYSFIVKNHPLEEIEPHAKKYGVVLSVMLVDGKVIGGYSLPNVEMVGACYSLHGKTLEEVTGLSYKQWSENWSKKYKK